MTAVSSNTNTLVYKGSTCMRVRLVLSVLSGRPVRINDIRKSDDQPGIREYEVSLIRLLDKVTNGTTIELDTTGTSIFFQPGLLHGGEITHECSRERGIGYYLEALAMLGFFCKVPLKTTLRGVTAITMDPSVDHIKASMITLLKKFVMDDEDLELKITKRGMLPHGGGEVIFKCPIRKQVRPIQMLDYGLVKRVRGTAYALRVSPAIANRMVESAKGVLLNFIPDIYIHTDQRKGKDSGKSPGFGIHLYAETTTGVVYSSEAISRLVTDGQEPSIPEDVGISAAQRLCHEIYLGGCTDSANQALAILFMALGPRDVSRLVVGPLTDYSISFLQHLREFFRIMFKVENYRPADEDDAPETDKVLLTCAGKGFINLSKRTI